MPPTPIPAASHLSVLGLIAGLILLPACIGEVQPPAESESTSSSSQPRRDASVRDAGGKRDAGRDAGRRDARAEPDPDDEEESDDESSPAPLTRDGGAVRVPDTGADETVDAAEPGDSASCDDDAPLATGLKVRELSLYQTVKVALFKSGTWATTTPVPIVAGKKTLLRVFVDPLPGYTKHAVRAVLKLEGAQGETTMEDERTIAVASTDADTASTFTFELDPTKVAPDTKLSVTLQETDCAATGGMATDARLPATGSQALGAQAIGKLKVVVVPIEVNGRLPKTDAAELAKISGALLAYFPVGTVDLTVRATPIRVSGTVAGTDSRTWSNTLNSVMRERSTDRAASDVYYFGLMQPAASMREYCGRGCILGIAPQTTRVSPSAQAGLGASFADEQSYETIVHELGHAHGRGHAPCVRGGGIEGVDQSFPDKGGGIGDWGWDSRSNKLISPTTHKDVMGYCSPNWISAYTYNALASRSKAVNTLAFVQAPLTNTTWRNVLLYDDGTARWGGISDNNAPAGDFEPAFALDAQGQKVADLEVTRVVLSHSEDQMLYVPAPEAGWDSLVIGTTTVKLADVLPPL